MHKLSPKIYINVLGWVAMFVCWKVVFFFKVSFEKVNYFLIFGGVIENKLENIF